MAEHAEVQTMLAEYASRMACQTSAIKHYNDGNTVSNVRRVRYSRFHKYYAPVDGDQWPEDKK